MKEEFRQALRDLRLAQNHFEYASENFIDVAIAELHLAEARLAAIKKESQA